MKIEFKTGNHYFCTKDYIINKQLAFKRNNLYLCKEDGVLEGCNGKLYCLNNVDFKEEVFKVKFKMKDNVNQPLHYTQGGIECIDAMESAYGTEAVIMFCMCNAFKYQWRFNKKNGKEDILKCQWYQNKMVELQNKLSNKNNKE